MQLTESQVCALKAVDEFLNDDTLNVLILRGSAGTGKTTLIGKIVELVDHKNLSVALWAPTGRAARILGSKVKQTTGKGIQARTVHSDIYALRRLEVNEEASSENDPGLRMIFPLKDEEPTSGLYIIDEASMIGDREARGDLVQFGSGRLLKDIVSYARLDRHGREKDNLTKLLFVGDPAQLPPVGEEASPALASEYLSEEHNLKSVVCDLTEVMRQREGSGILNRANEVKAAISKGIYNSFSLEPNDADVVKIEVGQALDHIEADLGRSGSTVVVVHSNAAALEYNRSIRERLWGDAEQPPRPLDTLLVNRNAHVSGLRNGDLVKILDAAPSSERFEIPLRGSAPIELSFRSAEVAYREYDGTVVKLSCFLLENLLNSRMRELSPLEQRAMLVHFRMRHPDLHPQSKEFRQALLADQYFSALQVKYGYAMTCHKAQGGEWDTAYVDFSHSGGVRNAAFFRWAYTAITRAKKRLYIVNPPEFDVIDESMWGASTPKLATASTPDATDPKDDTDWDRLSFSASVAPLMSTHQKLRERWAKSDITVRDLQHLQYCERYNLSRGDQSASVQYYYNGRYQISRYGPGPGVSVDNQLLRDALLAFENLATTHAGTETDNFIQDFLKRLDMALTNSPLRRTGFKVMPYRLRVSVSDTRRTADIDFTYDASSTWTAAQEVGGPGASHGIYDELQLLMSSDAG